MASSRSKFYFFNNMVCLLKALEGKQIIVEMRNNILVKGRLDFAECTMNLEMSHVLLTNSRGVTSNLSKFYVKGRHIMFVIIPEEVDIVKAMEWQIKKTDYFKDKERRTQEKTFQRIQAAKAKTAAKLSKQEQQ
uniref:Sm domain-containing protein n=1 Tax=Arion vulgaris TaxID=1028688 RepID=A0A0B6Y7C9_9EUPU